MDQVSTLLQKLNICDHGVVILDIQVAVEQIWAIQAFKYAETHFKVSS